MKLLIELDEEYVKVIDEIKFLVGGRTDRKLQLEIIKAIKNGKPLEQEPTTKNDLVVDCVSRAEIIDELNRLGRNAFKDDTDYDNFFAFVDSLLPVTPQEPKWIPVSERLPEEYKTVIASTKYNVYSEARLTKEDGWEWAYESGADYWEEIEDVIAWMPLPEPYKENEDGTN